MGDAKRRQWADPTYGQPEKYTLQIIPCKGLLAEDQVASAIYDESLPVSLDHYQNPDKIIITDLIEFLVPRCKNTTETNIKAIAIAHTIVGYLINPNSPEWAKRIGDERCLGADSVIALAELSAYLKQFYTRLDGGLLDKEERGEIIFTNILEAAKTEGHSVNSDDKVWEIAIGKK